MNPNHSPWIDPDQNPLGAAQFMVDNPDVHHAPDQMIKVVRGLLGVVENKQLFNEVVEHDAATINRIRDVVHGWAHVKGWWEKPEWRKVLEGLADAGPGSLIPAAVVEAAEQLCQQPVRNKGELLALLTSEVSELMEGLRKDGKMDDHVPELSNEAAEAADIFIRLMDYCGGFNIDIGKAVMLKHQYNITRPHRHGKKF